MMRNLFAAIAFLASVAFPSAASAANPQVEMKTSMGVIVLELVDSQFARFTEHSLLAVGLLAVLVGIFFPQGMIGLFGGRSADRAHGLWKRLRKARE